MKQHERERANGWAEINRLRFAYRIAKGNEAQLRTGIISLAERWDYPMGVNDSLFRDGFGCWVKEGIV